MKNESKQSSKIVNPLMSGGKLPPQATDLEAGVLGALMTQKDAILDIADILTSESFYRESHQHIYDAISDLNNNSQPIDLLTVVQKLKSKGVLDVVGGMHYISKITNSPAAFSKVEYHASIIEQKKIARDVINISSELIAEAYDETHDIFDLTEKMVTEAYNIGDVNKGSVGLSTNELLRKVRDKIENAKKMNGITGLRSGLVSQDICFGGYKPTNLYIKAARPAMGKTGLALSEANHIANVDKKKVLFFSIEMSEEQLMERLTSIHSEISLNKYASGNFTESDWINYNDKTSEMMNDNLKIIDIAGISLNKLRKIAKKHKLKFGLDIIYIDYLQLMTDPIKGNSNREQEVSRISVGLKGLAKDLQVPVVALAQLSRAVEQRGGAKLPQLSDLRESGSIEQDADVVQFLYRPDYYGITEDEEGNSTHGRADLFNAKNRHGAVGTIHVKFIADLTKFKDIEPDSLFNGFDNSTLPISDDFSHVPTSSQDRREDDEYEPF